MNRSLRMDVRNPLLTLPAFSRLMDLPKPQREALRAVLLDVAKDARARAEKCWRTHKAPMAAYWKAVAVYAGHTARALRFAPVSEIAAPKTITDNTGSAQIIDLMAALKSSLAGKAADSCEVSR